MIFGLLLCVSKNVANFPVFFYPLECCDNTCLAFKWEEHITGISQTYIFQDGNTINRV